MLELNKLNVMIDIETLGLAPDASILSIGAVVFSPENGLGEDKFYVVINPESYPELKIDASTLKFWVNSQLEIPINGSTGYVAATNQLLVWLSQLTRVTTKELVIWANGTDFDVPKLYNLFALSKMEAPWFYNAVRDCRTIFKLFGSDDLMPSKTIAKHHALEDAKWQAEYLLNIHERLNGSA
jgi:exodeoxyribonuclease VIII